MANEFLSWADAGGANVTPQATYQALMTRVNGFVAGVAPSAVANKIWRQTTAMAEMIGAFIDAGGYDALDDGIGATLLANFQASLASDYQGANQSLIGNGYQRFPGGLIIQWGLVTTGAGGSAIFTYPISFPNMVFQPAGIADGNNTVISAPNVQNNQTTIVTTMSTTGMLLPNAPVRLIVTGY